MRYIFQLSIDIQYEVPVPHLVDDVVSELVQRHVSAEQVCLVAHHHHGHVRQPAGHRDLLPAQHDTCYYAGAVNTLPGEVPYDILGPSPC